MESNIYIIFWTAFIPIIVGSIWYHPLLAGKVWANNAGISLDKQPAKSRMIKIAVTYIIGLLISFTLLGITVHQLGVMQVLIEQPGFADQHGDVFLYFQEFMADFGNAHRTFVHGLLHGATVSVTFAIPIIACIAFYENRGWKYLWVHSGFWTISLTIMSGLICYFF